MHGVVPQRTRLKLQLSLPFSTACALDVKPQRAVAEKNRVKGEPDPFLRVC